MKSAPTHKIVLCVDDEATIRCLLKSALERFGYTPLVASNGREALRAAAQHWIDAVILDYRMPDLNGGDVALEMKRFRPDVPIILFSGSDVPRSTRTHVDAFVAKSERISTLLAHLARLLEASAKRHEAIRRYPRFPARLPLAVTVSRASGLAIFHGISTELGEGGVGGVKGRIKGGQWGGGKGSH